MTDFEGRLRDAPPDTWFHVHRVSSPAYWGYWVMVIPAPNNGQPRMLSFHESELTIREIA